MENLKSTLADKALQTSNLNNEDMKKSLEKINRFRNFSNACSSLINKYPDIEDELIRMVKNDDFDTCIAASRVDTVIRLSEQKATNEQTTEDIKEDISKLEKIREESSTITEKGQNIDIENVFYEEISEITLDEPQTINIATTNNIQASENYSIETESSISEQKDLTETTNSSIKPQEKAWKGNMKKGAQILIAIIVILALIFGTVFVIRNWETVLWSAGAIAGLFLIIWILIKSKKRKNKQEDI